MIIDAAVVYEKSGPFNLERLELDRPDDDEVLVRMVATGVCHTDLAARDQHLPIPLPGVFGHEGAGVVEQIGARVTKVRPGDHVVLSWKYCGACPSCLSGAQSYCRDFFPHNFSGARPDGRITMRKGDQPIHGSFFGQSSFATFSLTHEKNVVPVRRDTPLEVLGPLGCGVLTGTGAVIHSLRPKAGSSIAVFGAGTVGLSAVMAAAICGCTTIITVDLNAERLKLAMELGATHAVSARQDDPVAAIRDLTGGGVQFSLECVGAPAVLRQAVEALAMPGVCGLTGVAPFGVDVNLEMQTILNGRTVKGILEGDCLPELFIPTLVDLHVRGRLPFDRLIGFYPFGEINRAVSDMEGGRVIKPVLRF